MFPLLSGDSAHNRLRVKTNHDSLHRGHDHSLTPGSSWLHHPGIHGGSGVLQVIKTKKQEQDHHLQQPGHHHHEEQEAVFDHQDW